MKVVVLVRHAKSSWMDPTLRDIDRPLNKRGKRDAPFMGKLLRGKSIVPDRLISSPANRAHTTAKHFAKALGFDKKDIQLREKIYEAYPDTIVKLIRDLDDELNTVALFGHNPTFTSVANRYTTQYIDNVPTCGVVVIEADIEHWSDFNEETAKLTAFYFPKQYF